MSAMAPEPPQATIVVYGLADARAAATAAAALDLPVTLRIPAGIAEGLGAEVIGSIFAIVRSEVPAARVVAEVDCANAPGLALALLRRGIERVAVDGPSELRRRIADIAALTGAALADETGDSLDLRAADDPSGACEAWLRGFKTGSAEPNCQ